MLFEDISFDQKSVKEVLVDMKYISELMVDLSLHSLFFDDKKIAESVLELEERMDDLEYDAIISTMLSARNYRDAELVAPVSKILGAIEDISNGSGDIAKLVKNDVRVPEDLRRKLSGSFNPVAVVDATDDMAGEWFVDFFGEDVEVLAVHRDGLWEVNKSFDTMDKGDRIIIKGPWNKLKDYRDDKVSFEEVGDDEYIDDVVSQILRMRELSELSIDLSFNAVISGSEFIAKEVVDLEESIDCKLSNLLETVLESSSEFDDPLILKGILNLGYAFEMITDASLEISESVLKGFDVHPVFTEAVQDSGDYVVRKKVESADNLENIVNNPSKVKAVKKKSREGFEWIVSPDENLIVNRDDILLIEN